MVEEENNQEELQCPKTLEEFKKEIEDLRGKLMPNPESVS